MTPKDKIKEKLSIHDVVSNYIKLEKSGNQWKARCPFHNEKTPSFYVSPVRQSFHCFGCAKGGDIFTFVMEIEKIEFLEALKVLANRAGVSLSEFKKEDNDNIYEVLSESKNYFVNKLIDNKNILARKYLLDRGIKDETIDEYNIGFADNEWTGLYDYLIKKGFTKESILSAGVCFVSEKSAKVLDKWRGRIMFPIWGQSDQVLGFTGRVLPEYDDGKQGKYVNSPETKVFKKNQILFNYNKAKKHIAETGEVILVEGQMDAIMSNQAGIKNVVAVSGTAFTDTHISILRRLSDNIVLCFDNDDAGLSARDRTALLCALAQFEIYNIDINDANKINDNETGGVSQAKNTNYKDVADIVKSDQNIWIDLVKTKKLFIDTLCQEAEGKTEKEKIDFIKSKILPFIKAYSSPLIQNHYLKIIASKLNYDLDILISEIKNVKRDVFIPENKREDMPKAKSYTEVDLLLILSAIYDSIKNINDSLDMVIEEFIKNKTKDLSIVSLDDLKLEFLKFPEEEINKKFIVLEKEGAINEKYFLDTLDKYIKFLINKKIEEADDIIVKSKWIGLLKR